MIISRRDNHGEHLEVKNYRFEISHSFKYLGVTINSINNNHEEINIRTTSTNKCYYGLTLTNIKRRVTQFKNHSIIGCY